MSQFWESIAEILADKFRPQPQPGTVAERMKLFWCTTDELRLMLKFLAVDTPTRYFVNNGDGGVLPLEVAREDVAWALKFVRRLDRAKAAEARLSFAEAANIYEKLLPRIGPSDYLLMRLGGCYANLGNLHRALLYLQKAASINPTNAQIQRWIQQCYQGRERA